MAGERVKNILDREPVWRKAEDAVEDPVERLRGGVNDVISEPFPEFENRNVGGGRVAGAVTAAVAVVLEDSVGLPFGASSDIQDTRSVDDGVVYTVNVNAPFESMAEARAAIDSTTGFTSFLTDQIGVESVTVQKTRIVRDTFEIEVLVED